MWSLPYELQLTVMTAVSRWAGVYQARREEAWVLWPQLHVELLR
jgi:hypothetical protein